MLKNQDQGFRSRSVPMSRLVVLLGQRKYNQSVSPRWWLGYSYFPNGVRIIYDSTSKCVSISSDGAYN